MLVSNCVRSRNLRKAACAPFQLLRHRQKRKSWNDTARTFWGYFCKLWAEYYRSPCGAALLVFFFLWATFGLETSGPNYPVTQHSVLPQRPLYECFLFLPKNKIDKAESIRNAVGFLRTLRGDHNGSLTSERSVVSLLWSSLRGENRYWLISVLNFVGYCARLRYLVFIRRGCFV